jgi:hypothetical protein
MRAGIEWKQYVPVWDVGRNGLSGIRRDDLWVFFETSPTVSPGGGYQRSKGKRRRRLSLDETCCSIEREDEWEEGRCV